MAVRRKPIPYVAPEDRPKPNLRFRPQGRGQWKLGYFVRWRDDGDIDLSQTFNGASRTMHPENVEFQDRGPRGGVIWKEAIWPMAPSPPKGA